MKIEKSRLFSQSYKKYRNNSYIFEAMSYCIDLILRGLLLELPHNHALKPPLNGYSAFAPLGAEYDLRVLYRIVNEDTVLFVAIGTHQELY